jgi:hypothetical protein
VLLLEFTIEPFHEGRPGPHVTAAIDAVEALGITGEVSSAIMAAAVAHGATHVNLHVERLDGAE